MVEERPLKVALLGCGVVGTQVAQLMTTHADDLAALAPS
jgi:homoserine dehydrogenase